MIIRRTYRVMLDSAQSTRFKANPQDLFDYILELNQSIPISRVVETLFCVSAVCATLKFIQTEQLINLAGAITENYQNFNFNSKLQYHTDRNVPRIMFGYKVFNVGDNYHLRELQIENIPILELMTDWQKTFAPIEQLCQENTKFSEMNFSTEFIKLAVKFPNAAQPTQLVIKTETEDSSQLSSLTAVSNSN